MSMPPPQPSAAVTKREAARQPILLVPYQWIGDFVRCHSVVQLLRSRWPDRPIDMLTTTNGAALIDYMPGVRKAIVSDLPRGRLPLRRYLALGRMLRAENYASAYVMPRTWKSALAPLLAGIPERIGFVGEARFILLNELRWGERKLPRMVDRCVALAMPRNAPALPPWPSPELVVRAAELATWRAKNGFADRPAVALAPGSVAAARRWPLAHYAEVARALAAAGTSVWVVGGPNETTLAQEIVTAATDQRPQGLVRDLTGPDLRRAILALKAATLAICNDSGLLHVAAALGTPTIGIFGPADPYLSEPLNPLAAVIETRVDLPCRPCGKHSCPLDHHRCMREIPAEQVLEAARRALARAPMHA